VSHQRQCTHSFDGVYLTLTVLPAGR
jgi:hypothetical protein